MSETNSHIPQVYVSKLVPVDELEPNPWNPNQMSDREFNRLAEEISNVGFIDQIQAIPMENGKLRIIGGEHRWRAAKSLGIAEVPVAVLSETKWKDVDLQKFVTVRLNVIKGKLDPERMVGLYNELAQRYGEDAMQNLMGFTDEAAFKKLVGGVREALESTGLSGDMLEKFDEMKKEVKTIDDLSAVLNHLFNEYGDTITQNFMVFTYGSKEHLYIACDAETFKQAKAIADRSMKAKVDINQFLHRVLKDWEKDVEDLPKEPVAAAAEEKPAPEAAA
jgi:hypothetical protein